MSLRLSIPKINKLFGHYGEKRNNEIWSFIPNKKSFCYLEIYLNILATTVEMGQATTRKENVVSYNNSMRHLYLYLNSSESIRLHTRQSRIAANKISLSTRHAKYTCLQFLSPVLFQYFKKLGMNDRLNHAKRFRTPQGPYSRLE